GEYRADTAHEKIFVIGKVRAEGATPPPTDTALDQKQMIIFIFLITLHNKQIFKKNKPHNHG
ncbi:hypothetical protein, partial [Enterobacter hormaechei]